MSMKQKISDYENQLKLKDQAIADLKIKFKKNGPYKNLTYSVKLQET